MARPANGGAGGYFDRVAAPRRGQALVLSPTVPRFADMAPSVGLPVGLPEMVRAAPPRATAPGTPPASTAAFSTVASSRQPLTPAPDGAVASTGAIGPQPPLAAPVEPAALPPPELAFARLERLAMQPGQAPSVSAAARGPTAPEADVSPDVAALMPAPIVATPPFKLKAARLAPVAHPEAVALPGPPPMAVHPGAPETSPRALPPATPVAPPSIHIGLVEVRVAAPAPASPVFAPSAAPPAAPRGALARGYGWRYGVGQS